MGEPVSVILVESDGVRCRAGMVGREVVESADGESSRLLAFSADLRLWTSTPESMRFGADAALGVTTAFGGRTTTDNRFHKCVSFSGNPFNNTGSLFCVLSDRVFDTSGFVGSGGTGSLSSFFENICRMMARRLSIDLLRFSDLSGTGSGSASISVSSES